MDGFEGTRRGFLKKLGLSVGATLAVMPTATAKIIESKIDFPLTDEQDEFMNGYETWMDDFIEVIKVQRNNPDDLDNNKRLVALTEQSEAWQPKIREYMSDENFARYYMIASERMTKEIS